MLHHRTYVSLALVVILAVVMLLLTDSLARQNNPLRQLDLLVNVRHEIVRHFVEEPDQQAMMEAAVRGMINALNDPYTSFLGPDDLEPLERTISGRFSGIGAEVEIDPVLNRLRIVTPLEDSPAWHAGVLAGDIVLEIDGASTADMSLPEAIKRLTGEAGTQVTIRVRHESGEERDIAITREQIRIATVRGFRRGDDQQFIYLMNEESRIAYIRIRQFNANTIEELAEAIELVRQSQARGLILDVRFNSGGLLEAAVGVSDAFLGQGKVILDVRGRAVPDRTHTSTAKTLLPDLPMVVLANEASASAAEIVAGALKDNDRALFVGTRTFGKGSVQQIRMLEEGQTALKITNAYWYIPSGRNIHRKPDSETWGVDPNEGCYVTMDAQQVRKMMDIRREKDRLSHDNANGLPDSVTADWVEEHLYDLQLAAAMRAMEARLTRNEWIAVGKPLDEALAQVTRRETLVTQRDALEQRLAEINRELQTLGVIDQDEPQDAEVPEDNG